MSAENDRVFNVLFLCTGNSARSILAEAALTREGMGKFKAFSAGSHPKGEVQSLCPRSVEKAQFQHRFRPLQILGGIRRRPMRRRWILSSPSAISAAAETCPVWPGQPMTAHWGVPDPAAATGTEAEIRLAFADAFRMLNPHLDFPQPAHGLARPAGAAKADQGNRRDERRD